LPLQRAIRRLFPQDDSSFDLLEQMALLTNAAVKELARLEERDPEQVADAVLQIEHRADKSFHEVEPGLARTFVTPLDRDDIHQLAAEIDDVIDTVNVTARVCSLLRVTAFTAPMRALLDILDRCTQELGGALPLLRRFDFPSILAAGRSVRSLEKDADAIYRQALGGLFQDPAVDAKQLLRERSVLEHIEEGVNRCERLAKTLSIFAVKYG